MTQSPRLLAPAHLGAARKVPPLGLLVELGSGLRLRAAAPLAASDRRALLPRAVRVFFGMWAIVFFFRAALIAFFTFLRAPRRCFSLAMSTPPCQPDHSPCTQAHVLLTLPPRPRSGFAAGAPCAIRNRVDT